MTHVDWKPYPKDKPRRTGDYLVTFQKRRKLYVTKDCYDINEGDFEIDFYVKVVAWAEMPEPYNPENKND